MALNSATFNAARVVGPAVAGLTIGAFDISVAFLLNGLSFLAVIAAYGLMRDEELRPAPRLPRPASVRAVGTSLAEGLRYVRSTDLVLLAVVVVGLVSTFGMNFGVVIPALAQDVLGVDATGYGLLMAATGAGSLVAALAIAFSPRARPGLIVAGAIVLGVAEMAAALVQRLPARPGGHAVRGPGRHRHDGHGQHDHPAQRAGRAARPRRERLHHGLRGLHAHRRAAHRAASRPPSAWRRPWRSAASPVSRWAARPSRG